MLAVAVALTSACGSPIAGRPSCPGCGKQAEPSFPTTRPNVSPPTSTSPPPSMTVAPPSPTLTAPPDGAVALAPDSQGVVFIQTKSGKTRCQISRHEVGCEAPFVNPPMRDGEPANGVKVTSGGELRWLVGNLGDIPAVTLDYQTYRAQGWTIAASGSGTRFTNDDTGHGMFVSIQAVNGF
ncbi:MAG: lpqJ [Mycobacterium sp.]|nr:lpqJ [Mycobacterium sp.]